MLVMLAVVLQATLLLAPLVSGPGGPDDAPPTPAVVHAAVADAAALAQDAGAPPPAGAPVEPAPAPPAPAPQAPAGDAAAAAARRAAAAELPTPPAELPPLEAPPTLPATKVEALKREVSKLRASNPAALKGVQAEVLSYGRAAIPALTRAATTNHPIQMEAVVECLTALADYRDRDFVEASLASPLPVMRRFAARKIGEYALPLMLDKLPPLLEDRDGAVQLEATLALLANGREDGLALAAAAFGGPARERVLAVLPRIAGRGPHDPLAQLLRIDPQREKEEPQVAADERLSAVALLRAIGDPVAQSLIVKALDDKHNLVKVEAINALRDLLEGRGPLEKSSIFQQIDEVKRLKALWAAR
jgi:hypothetical protein